MKIIDFISYLSFAISIFFSFFEVENKIKISLRFFMLFLIVFICIVLGKNISILKKNLYKDNDVERKSKYKKRIKRDKFLMFLLCLALLINLISYAINLKNEKNNGTSVVSNSEISISDVKVCLSSLERVAYSYYTGNLADSRINILGEDFEFGYGNVGLNGEIFENGFEAWIARWNNIPEKSWVYATYDLASGYNYLNICTSLIQSYNTKNFSTSLIISGDGNVLHSQVLTGDDYEFEFSVNVSNVNHLTIMLKDNVAVEGGTSFALYNLYLTT